jgi:hypothetical protein
MQNEQRRIDVSNMVRKMGESLIQEASTNQDPRFIQLGSIFNLISVVMLVDVDMFLFSEMCSMFSAKKIMESVKDIGQDDPILDFIKKISLKVESEEKNIKKPVKKVAKKKAVPKKKAAPKRKPKHK